MTTPMTQATPRPRSLPRSIGAVVAGFLAVAVLSVAVDQVLHVLNVYPPWGQPMHEPELNALALSYRLAFTILGGYITARLAPRSPMRHAIILGIIGTVAALAGALATIPKNWGPSWYPILLVVTALPCTWLGGWMRTRT